MQNVAFIKTGDGNITLVIDSKSYAIGATHPNHARILDALKSKDYDSLETLVDIPKTIETKFNSPSSGKVTVQDGEVLYNGLPMHNTITERIMAFLGEDLPTEPLIRFLENLMQNPMPMAIAELYDFLENGGFPITDDGCFIGYKSVRDNFRDWHSGQYDNSVGKKVQMERSEVDPDRRNECSYGLHVGTIQYARGFQGGGTIILVKVNPRDCIAVPKDYNCSKLRVCEYEVIGVAQERIETPMYPMPVVEHEPDDETDEYGDPTWAADEDDDWMDEEGACDVVTTKTVKRPPCAYCGAKGGKKHAADCDRP